MTPGPLIIAKPPTPYYQSERVTLYCGDCLSILPTLSGVGALVTDPPYGIAYDGSHTKYHNGIDRGPCEWDDKPFDPAPLIALGLPTIMWGGNCFSSRLPDSTAWLVWVKIVRQDADIRQSDCEMAWTNCFGRSRVFTHLWIGAYRDSESGIQNVHPTQKPVALMRWCIEQSKISEAATILDPYCGSGTTGIAAVQLGRRFVGVEREEKYCAIAKRRIIEAENAFALFDPPKPEQQAEMFAGVAK